ncbi:putative GPI-anchored adhesin-like protein PGA55 isoform X2 [Iris pallida]|uniref:GPI-anchored adhesin-like protein PGA55 isoform X2 n=1 Tax=Iris pallida TaxID=29817 RepID=A0AAX6FP55_IRIPA|nr:putative GPI-anchored adhesin-like protein PGA55 isoform X2 [Iris pallida]
MDAGTLLDCARFQLSPCRTRCELFVSGEGRTEKLASGFLKPFLTHLRVAEEQASNGVQSIKLEIEKRKNDGTWFNKGTLERFVRFVSTPEVLELVNTFDAEMSQLEGARKIYSQGAGDRLSGREGDAETTAAATADVTKKELLRAIDVRLSALKQDLVTACARASAAGFTLDTVSELVLFADRFGAIRLHEACTKFISLSKQRPELLCHLQSLPPQWKGFDDANIRSSGSDMSIDELETNSYEQLKAPTSGSLDSHKPSSGGLPQKSTAEAKASARFLAEKALDKDKEELTPVLSDEPAQPAGKGSRRLSVQDRINLFESKQKEQSVSTSVTSSSSGAGGINKVIAGKGEHRRLPSDASMEKSVLRRWSGASDMSIDLNNNSFTSERKECGSVAGTPTSTVNSHDQSGCKAEEIGLKDTATSRPQMNPKGNGSSISSSLSQEQVKTFPKDRVLSDDVIMTDDITTTNKAQSEDSLEEQGNFQAEFDSSLGGALQNTSIAPAAFQFISKRVSDSEGSEAKDQAVSLTHFKARSDTNVGSKNQEAVQIQQITVPATFVQGEYNDRAVESTLEVKRQATSGTKFRTFAEKPNAGAKAKASLDCQIQSKTSLGKAEGSTPKNDLPSEAQWKTLPGNKVEARRKEVVASSQEPLRVSSVEMEEKEFGSQLHGNSAASDQIKKVKGRREEIMTNHGTRVPATSGKKAREGVHVLQPPSTPSVEQTQVARPSKGNQELNDELQIKANELERLFAAHKLRGHGDQMASSRRNKHVDDHALMSAEKVLPESLPDQLLEQKLPRDSLRNGVQFDANQLRLVDNLNCSQDMKQKLGDLSPSDDFRGILYEKYMQKRDEKLREDWGTKRAQKEAKLKAMHDSLVHSQAEMKAKFTGFADNQHSAFAQHRAERLRSFNVRSGRKTNGQQKLELLQVEGEEDLQGRENNLYGQDRSHSDTPSGNESSTSSKKLVSSKSLSSSTSRTSINPIPRPSAKATNSSSFQRRAQPENSLAQSVPNFSDFRKENTKPSTRLSKVTSSEQPRVYARSKSTIEEANLVKDEKSHRSHSMRKRSTNSGELKNLTPLSSYAANQTPFRISKDRMDQGVSKSMKSGDSKSFLMKGNGIGPGAAGGVSKLKAFMNPETLKDGEESDELVDLRDDSPCVVKDEEEEFYRTSSEGNLQDTEFPVDLDSEDDDSESRNGDVLRSLSHVGDDFAAVPSKFGPSVGTMHESPGESPGSWNSNTHHSFSYAHEASDFDASVESPTGSPTSWNSFPLNQMMEADAARMRKKWGSAQIPVLVANASNQSCKDTTKGFKKFLKFGRKSRGVDYLVNDWVSASTASEGDDDTEDGREAGSRSSEDLRKSRMGYSIPTSYGFNEGDAFPEQGISIPTKLHPKCSCKFQLEGGSSIWELYESASFISLSHHSEAKEMNPSSGLILAKDAEVLYVILHYG